MKLISRNRLQALSREAVRSARRRANWNLHGDLGDPTQRFCNAMEPGTYVRPHRHQAPARWELFLALAGEAVVVTFDELGCLRARVSLRAEGVHHGVEIPAGVWHSLACLEAGTVLFEIKPGPYVPLTDKDFASWAPAEGQSACADFEGWFRAGAIGSRPPAW